MAGTKGEKEALHLRDVSKLSFEPRIVQIKCRMAVEIKKEIRKKGMKKIRVIMLIPKKRGLRWKIDKNKTNISSVIKVITVA